MMRPFNHQKYRPFPVINMPDRSWPDQVICQAPTWCSVDLRDGNQALAEPMNVAQKLRMFQLLLQLGFKEIEVGFPAASQADFDFVRRLIDEQRIPDDVTIQVLTQARTPLIERTYEALSGVKQAIVHVYNSTSTVQREQVFQRDRQGIIDIATAGANAVQSEATAYPDTHWTFQYSPESFTGTELDFAVEICSAVIDIWKTQANQRVIINLPATVEMATPNVFADQVEGFCRALPQRDQVEISLHTHNDRGCAIAAAELGLMAGADRVEGTLLGNGERTGNMDIITMAMNLYSQGIDPQLDLSHPHEIIECIHECTQIAIHPRHPWFGEQVYTAFSGSHQDAIKKSMAWHQTHDLAHWEVAYLPIDPRDLGREYREIVRINSQSGKGGVALVLERDHGISLPRWMQQAVSQRVQQQTEASGKEISSAEIYQLFISTFVEVPAEWTLHDYDIHTENGKVSAEFYIGHGASHRCLKGHGKGVFEALAQALTTEYGVSFRIIEFDEHAMSRGTSAQALAMVSIQVNGQQITACAIHKDSSKAGLQALVSTLQRAIAWMKQHENRENLTTIPEFRDDGIRATC